MTLETLIASAFAVVATLAYTVKARRRISEGNGTGLYHPLVAGGVGVFIFVVVGATASALFYAVGRV